VDRTLKMERVKEEAQKRAIEAKLYKLSEADG
jgi:hypothetical protein